MKTELKTAKEKIDRACKNVSGLDKLTDWHKEWLIRAVESHTSERLDHLRQQLEESLASCARFAENGNEKWYMPKAAGLEEAISLIDQLKAEMK